MRGIKRGAVILEYSMLIFAFCAALAVMDVYIKRAVQGNLKASTSSIGEQFSADYSNYTYVLTEKKKTKDTVTPAGVARSELLDHEFIHRSPYTDSFSGKKLSGFNGEGYNADGKLIDLNGNGVYDPPPATVGFEKMFEK